MEEIYIIFADSNYDDESSPEAIDFKLTEEEAIVEVNRLNVLYAEAERIRFEVMKPLYGNVMEPHELPKYHEIPKWRAGIPGSEITKEMRDGRNRLKAENESMSKDFNDLVSNRRDILTKKCIEDLEAMNLSDELKILILNTPYLDSFSYHKLIKK